MFTITAVALLSGLAVTLNAYAAKVADRTGRRRAALEAHWAQMIEAAQEEDTAGFRLT